MNSVHIYLTIYHFLDYVLLGVFSLCSLLTAHLLHYPLNTKTKQKIVSEKLKTKNHASDRVSCEWHLGVS